MKSFFQYFKSAFAYIGALASIVGFLIILFQEATSIIILVAFCIFLLIILIKIFLTINTFLSLKSREGYENISSMLKYYTPDGKSIEFNHYKVIQAKKMIFTEYDSKYKWDGKDKAEISSSLQEIVKLNDDNNPGTYDTAILKLKKPIFYNQNEVIHFCGISEDPNEVSKTEVEAPFKLIHFLVVLQQKISLRWQNCSKGK